MLLYQGGRPFRYTHRSAPDVAGYEAHVQALAARRIILDDGQRASNVSPIRYLGGGVASASTLRLGDQLTNLTGVLRYSRGSGSSGIEGYRLMPTEDPAFDAINQIPAQISAARPAAAIAAGPTTLRNSIASSRKSCPR